MLKVIHFCDERTPLSSITLLKILHTSDLDSRLISLKRVYGKDAVRMDLEQIKLTTASRGN